jgi:hypothetical protein
MNFASSVGAIALGIAVELGRVVLRVAAQTALNVLAVLKPVVVIAFWVAIPRILFGVTRAFNTTTAVWL